MKTNVVDLAVRCAICAIGLGICAIIFTAGSANPSWAKPKIHKTCDQKAEECHKRCLHRYPNNVEQQGSCVGRTCAKQEKNCFDAEKKPSKRDGSSTRRDQNPGPVQRKCHRSFRLELVPVRLQTVEFSIKDRRDLRLRVRQQ